MPHRRRFSCLKHSHGGLVILEHVQADTLAEHFSPEIHGRIIQEPGFRVQAVDTLGAGDVWHGAFALALGEQQPIAQALRFANAAAALKCTRPGGREGIPSRAQTEAFMRNQLLCN